MTRALPIVFCAVVTCAMRGQQCEPALLQKACPSFVQRSQLVQDPSAIGKPPAGPTAINGIGAGSAVNASFVPGRRTFWSTSDCDAKFQLDNPLSFGVAGVLHSVLRDPSVLYDHVFVRGVALLASDAAGPANLTLLPAALPRVPTDLAADKAGTARYAFANHVDGRVSVCMTDCDRGGKLADFDFTDVKGNPLKVSQVRLQYPNLVVVVVGASAAGTHIYHADVARRTKQLLTSNAGPQSTADVNVDLVVFSQFVPAIPQARYQFSYWRIGTPVANIQPVFLNPCGNFDFRHPRLTNTHLIFVMAWLNTPPKAEVEALPLATLGTKNQIACIMSGDLIVWDPLRPWHEVWQAGKGLGVVSFYDRQSLKTDPSLRATCWY